MKRVKREVWKKIPGVGLPEYFEVSNKGRLRSLPYIDRRGWRRKGKIIPTKNAEVWLTKTNGKNKWFPLAALILRAFVSPPPKDCRLSRHLDDNRENNNLENLAWGTDRDNVHDAIRNGANFATYGHQGKTHSEKTKAYLSALFKGKPTGRKMTPEHRAAIWAGYRRRFPAKEENT